MPVSLPLTDRISQGSTRSRKNRVLRAQFGDGYSQTAPDGINTAIDTWSVSFENLTVAERTTLWDALDEVGGSDYFTWTPPGGSAGKFKVTGEISEAALSGEIYSVSFQLEQVFG